MPIIAQRDERPDRILSGSIEGKLGAMSGPVPVASRAARAPSRRFPHPGWTWPTGGLHQLLVAAISPDRAVGLAAALAWLSANDIDAAPFSAHRLLAAIGERYGAALSGQPEYPRLKGIQRMIWARALIASRETAPALQALRAAGIEIMLVKGAARTALDPSVFKSRVSYDLDVLMRPEQFRAAFDILAAAGWTPSSGESVPRARARLSDLRSINMFGGQFGDIDLHQSVYGAVGARADLEAALWAHARPGVWFGVPVRVPSATDSAALAIVLSALDGHRHSDWVVDSAVFLTSGEVDWARLEAIFRSTGQIVVADCVIGYLRDGIGLDLPDLQLTAPGMLGRLAAVPYLVQAKPRADHTGLSRAGRWFAKQLGYDRVGENPTGSSRIRGRLRRTRRDAPQRAVLTAPLPVAEALDPGACAIELDLEVRLNGARRRVEFELWSDERFVTRLHARNWTGLSGTVTARFRGRVVLPDPVGALVVVAQPNRHPRGVAKDVDLEDYREIPFKVSAARLKPL